MIAKKRIFKKNFNETSPKPLKNAEVTDAIAKGAIGIAITAGVVAAGVAFMNEETRKKAVRNTKVGLTKLSEIAAVFSDEPEEQYRVVASQVSLSKKPNSRKSTKSKKVRM